jgi:hypothetical protein
VSPATFMSSRDSQLRALKMKISRQVKRSVGDPKVSHISLASCSMHWQIKRIRLAGMRRCTLLVDSAISPNDRPDHSEVNCSAERIRAGQRSRGERHVRGAGAAKLAIRQGFRISLFGWQHSSSKRLRSCQPTLPDGPPSGSSWRGAR